MNDGEVVCGLREGRPDAWRALYDVYAERVWCGVARRVPPADVPDVVQETLLAAARSARNFNDAKGSLWNWLWGIARMQIALHYRNRERDKRILLDANVWGWLDGNGEPPVDLLESAELADAVRRTLSKLPDEYESLLAARYFDGESVERIAVREGSTEVAVRSKLARAREAFRRAFGISVGAYATDVESSHVKL